VTQVNLLPREVKQRQTVRRRTGLVAVFGALVVGVILVFWFLQGVRLQDLDDQLAAQNAVNADLQTQVASLQKYADQKASLDQQKALLKSAVADTVEWSGVLNDVSKIQPSAMWLSSLTGTAAAPTAVVPVPGEPVTPTTGPQLIGTIQFQGNSLDTETISLWLTKLEGPKGWVNPWMGSATLGDINGTPVWVFSSSVDLDSRAAHKGGNQ
jgi:Tfp pilus assembly protein PilN